LRTSHSNIELLKHISDEINFILNTVSGKTKEQFLSDAVITRATIRSLEIIGEATKKTAPDFRNKYPDIDWKGMAGTRDKLIHDYFGIDYNLVWDIIVSILPVLKEQIKQIIETEA
jgi:uncharacterized protein with HEPN domain